MSSSLRHSLEKASYDNVLFYRMKYDFAHYRLLASNTAINVLNKIGQFNAANKIGEMIRSDQRIVEVEEAVRTAIAEIEIAKNKGMLTYQKRTNDVDTGYG